ncbi:MAG: DUF502 domain-containing protein [Opitutales bacterium]
MLRKLHYSPPMLRSLRNAFITGIIVILPLGVTVMVIGFLLEKIGTPASNLFFWFLDSDWRKLPSVTLLLQSISVIVVVVMITALGYFSRVFIGRFTLSKMDILFDRVPFINTVYRTVKQIVDTFSQQQKTVFRETVLIEYPRPGSYAIGFLTSSTKGEVQSVTNDRVLNVFVPTTPNPTSGFLLMLPEEDITHLKMSIVDGMKLIISGGVVVPPYDDAAPVEVENPSAGEQIDDERPDKPE